MVISVAPPLRAASPQAEGERRKKEGARPRNGASRRAYLPLEREQIFLRLSQDFVHNVGLDLNSRLRLGSESAHLLDLAEAPLAKPRATWLKNQKVWPTGPSGGDHRGT